MNVPAVAQRTFSTHSRDPIYMEIVRRMVQLLSGLKSGTDRARLVHQEIDAYNKEVFSNPVVKAHSPCTAGCSACCHTQVSTTHDEAQLLARSVSEGIEIDQSRLQRQTGAGNSSEEFYKLSYEDRRCVFLDQAGSCRVYSDRPAVCRTNAVLGSADQCDTRQGPKTTRLILTHKADMVIYAAYLSAPESGTLPVMLTKALADTQSVD